MANNYKIKFAGDCGITIEFENTISEDVNRQVVELKNAVENSETDGIIALVPTYRSLLIQYDSSKITYQTLIEFISQSIKNIGRNKSTKSKIYVIPVCYGGDYGPDIETVSTENALDISSVIDIHSSKDYRIYMLGFTPGFPYLGGMDKRIETARLEKPRTKIYAGSVGIAGGQTGIYPIDSPGGWQIIGRTPLKLFDRTKAQPFLLEAGAYIRFKPIDVDAFNKIEAEIEQGVYRPEIEISQKKGV